jgi:hypothetical protein
MLSIAMLCEHGDRLCMKVSESMVNLNTPYKIQRVHARRLNSQRHTFKHYFRPRDRKPCLAVGINCTNSRMQDALMGTISEMRELSSEMSSK